MLRFLGVKDSENSVYIFFNVRVHVFQRPCTKICTYDIGSSTPAGVSLVIGQKIELEFESNLGKTDYRDQK